MKEEEEEKKDKENAKSREDIEVIVQNTVVEEFAKAMESQIKPVL